MQRSGDGSAGGGGVTAPGPKSLLGISCRDGSAPSPQKLPDPWPTKLSPNPHRVPTILAPEICPSGCSPCWSCSVGCGASLEGAWFESQTVVVCSVLGSFGLDLEKSIGSLVQVR